MKICINCALVLLMCLYAVIPNLYCKENCANATKTADGIPSRCPQGGGPYVCVNPADGSDYQCYCQPGFYFAENGTCLATRYLCETNITFNYIEYNAEYSDFNSKYFINVSNSIVISMNAIMSGVYSDYVNASVVSYSNASGILESRVSLFFYENTCLSASIQLSNYVTSCNAIFECFGLYPTTVNLTNNLTNTDMCTLGFKCPASTVTDCIYIPPNGTTPEEASCSCTKGYDAIGGVMQAYGVASFTLQSCATFDYCSLDVCGENSNHCNNGAGWYTCSCKSGYYFDQTTCVRCPCKNSGTCTTGQTSSGYVCQCTAAYDGENCENALPLALIITIPIVILILLILIGVSIYLFIRWRRTEGTDNQQLISQERSPRESSVGSVRSVGQDDSSNSQNYTRISKRKQQPTMYENMPYLSTMQEVKIPRPIVRG